MAVSAGVSPRPICFFIDRDPLWAHSLGQACVSPQSSLYAPIPPDPPGPLFYPSIDERKDA
jgi:hypothetical protein